jgi:hypothetical protein
VKKKAKKKRESPHRAVQAKLIAARRHDGASDELKKRKRGPEKPIEPHIQEVAVAIGIEKHFRKKEQRGPFSEGEWRKEFAENTARDIMNIILAGHGEELLKAERKRRRLDRTVFAVFDWCDYIRSTGKPLNVPMLMQELARACGGKERVPLSERYIRRIAKPVFDLLRKVN